MPAYERTTDLLHHVLLGKPDFCALRFTREDGGKGYRPQALRDPALLVHEHFNGDGTWQAGAYTQREFKKGFFCAYAVFDFDVMRENHPTGFAAPGDALTAAKELQASLTAHGLTSTLERSQSGFGFHVWVLWSGWLPLADAYRFGRYFLKDQPHLECFPKSEHLAAGKKGSLIALPCAAGSKSALWCERRQAWLRDRVHVPVNNVEAVRDILAIQPLVIFDQPKQHPVRVSRVGDMPPVSCEAVLRHVAPERITKETEATLFVDCPAHASRSKISLHVDRAEDVFYCHGCGEGGKSWVLLTWLMPDAHPYDLRQTMLDVAAANGVTT